VLSRDARFAPPGVEVVPSLEAAISAAGDEPELMIIGGGALYALALPRTDRVLMTRLHMNVDGDAHFPALSPAEWREVSRSPRRPADERNACDMTFLELERR
jgi:dihydrofolate reductase